jgi:hypothetical protein
MQGPSGSATGNTNRFQLVGETYVHDAMEGEKWDEDLLERICMF